MQLTQKGNNSYYLSSENKDHILQYLPTVLGGETQPRSQTLAHILKLILISSQLYHHLNAKDPFLLEKNNPTSTRLKVFVSGSKQDKQNTQTQRNKILLSSEQFLKDLNVFKFMPETSMYHFICRFVKEVSLQLSQDKISKRMPCM